jgi:glucose-1-phosphate thymidylyltransferase
MKLIIPMAGKGDMLKPHTHITPKALVKIAGKPLIEHVIESVSALNFEKIIFIVDQSYPELEANLEKKYSQKTAFIMQKERKGVGHAILGAKKYIEEKDDAIIVFADTLVETDLKIVKKHKYDGIIWTEDVKDPRNYGVAFLQNGFVTKLIEKPDTPVSDKALVGLYYFKQATKLFKALEFLINNDIKTKGEYQLTDAIQIMINEGSKIEHADVKVWHDCGTVANLLETSKLLLKKSSSIITKLNTYKNTSIIQPVHIEKGADITNSVIGPNVSVGKDAVVKNSIISNSIIRSGAQVNDAILQDCIIGRHTKVHGSSKKFNLGDSSEIYY